MRQRNKHSHIDHSITFVVIIFVLILFSAIQIAAQETEKPNIESSANIKLPDSPQATGDEINFKNNSGNSILTITDEGSDKGSITLPSMSSPPYSTTNKLYNESGILKFDGSTIGSGSGSVTAINDLSDGKYENLSLFLGTGSGNSNSNAYGNTGIGYQALYKNLDDQNTAIGRSAGYENTTGGQNVLIGPETNRWNQTGNNNTILGFQAGYGASTLHNKSGNVFIGFQAGYNELGSNKLYIENSNTSSPLIWGDFATNEVKINGDFEITGNFLKNGFLQEDDWDALGNELLLFNTSKDVGIGTNSGETVAKLHVKGDKGVLFHGTHGSGTALNLGSSTRFHFYPKKSAIRGGNVNGTQWNDANIGDYSTAFGQNTIANGFISTALGSGTQSSGSYSASLGVGTKAEAFYSTAIGAFNIGGGSPTTIVGSDPVLEVGIGTSDGTRANAMTVLKNGKVGIGTNSTTYRMEIKSETGENPLKVKVNNSGKLTVFSNGGTSLGTDATAPTNGLLVSGEIRNTGGLLHASDLRFKTNIEEIPNVLYHIQNLRGVYYDWRRDEFPDRNFNDKKQIGVIAQEVEKEFPALVNTDEDGYKSVDYTKLSAILIEAVKEQNTTFRNENNKLLEKINELEKKLDKIEKVFDLQKFTSISY